MIGTTECDALLGRGFPRTAVTFGVLVEDRYIDQAQPAGLIRSLRAAGHSVEIIVAQSGRLAVDGCVSLTERDLLIARGRSLELLRTLAWVEDRGVPTINSRSAIAAVHNKAEMTARLATAGIAMPATVFGSPQQLASRLDRRMYPILLKPIYGDNGKGIQRIDSPEDLRRVHGPVLLAQQFVANDGFDLKLYCIGDLTFAVRKPCPIPALLHGTRAEASKPLAQLIPATADMRRIARRCGELFGLELFGVDLLETDEGLKVIEVNDFPNYTAVPEASERLAEYVCGRSQQGRNS